jgi:soluble cytochrome b562
MVNVLNQSELKDIFLEIESQENKSRKYKAYKELDIYNQNQAKYIDAKISQIYGADACNTIQTITSINLATRIVSAEASIYKKCPERTFSGASEAEQAQINALYEEMCADEKLKVSNRLFKLGSQCTLMLVPDLKEGSLRLRALYKHQYDVVPCDNDPDEAEIYVIPLNSKPGDTGDRELLYNRGDNINQRIADTNDTDLSRNRYVVWTEQYNFLANGNGQVLNPETGEPWYGYTEEDVANPIGELPFIDVSCEKLFGYWVDHGSSLTDFTITFGCILSDMGEIVKLQGYSQPVISSIEEPKTISVGPHRVLWLKKDKNLEGDMNPTFEFATPSPDIDGSLNFIENVLRMFLTSRGTDSKLVSSKEQKDFSSGFERLLAMIDKSEASMEDKILYSRVEQELFELTRLWNNYLQENKADILDDVLRGTKLSDNIEVSVKFVEPMQIQTQAEKEDSVIKRMDAGLMSKLMGIMELYALDKPAAEEMLAEINANDFIPKTRPKSKVVATDNENMVDSGDQ